jgi:anti-anti-sigma factor
LKVACKHNTLGVRLLEAHIIDEEAVTQIIHHVKTYITSLASPVVILDFKKVQHISSRMLGALLELDRHVRRRDGRLALVHLQMELMEIFTVTSLMDRLSIYDSMESAMHHDG